MRKTIISACAKYCFKLYFQSCHSHGYLREACYAEFGKLTLVACPEDQKY